MKNYLCSTFFYLLLSTQIYGQEPQNILGVSFLHRSDLRVSNSKGIGINIERYHSKIKYLSYGINAEYFAPSKYLDLYSSNANDGFIVNSKSTFKVGGRLALHLQKGKFDFYAGGQLSLVSDQYHFMNFNSTTSSVYNPYGYGTQIGSYGNNTNYRDEKYRSVLFEPFIGVRYYPVKNIGIQIEGSQRKTAMGLVVKF